MIKDYIVSKSGKSYPVIHIKKIFKEIGKYHGGEIRVKTIEIIDLYVKDAEEIAKSINLKIISEEHYVTETFDNSEVQIYLQLYHEENNKAAFWRLIDLFIPSFKILSKAYVEHSVEDSEDAWINFRDECILNFDSVINYYFSKKESGRIVAKDGYKKPVDFSLFVRIRLLEVPRLLANEDNIFDFGAGRDRRKKQVKDFVEMYKTTHNGMSPTEQEIADALGIKKLETVRLYLKMINTKVVSGDEPQKCDQDENKVIRLFEKVEDYKARFDEGTNFDNFVVRCAVRSLGSVRCAIICLKYGVLINTIPLSDKDTMEYLGIGPKTYKKLLNSAMRELESILADYNEENS